MNDAKIFAKNEKEIETLIQTIRIFSQDIGMEFGIEKYKSRKRETTEIKFGEKENFKNLRMLEVTLKREKNSLNQVLLQKSHQRNKHLGSPHPLLGYSGAFFK